jgi:hypothetical protein
MNGDGTDPHKCHVLNIEKVKILFLHHVPQKEHERYWDPFFLKLPVQDVYQDIVILSSTFTW